MTFSMVARCERTGELGVAAMTAMIGVGKLVAHAQAGVGAAASQAIVNPYLAYHGLRALEDGDGARETLEMLVARDPGRDGRQFALLDANGTAACHTGTLPEDWKGHHVGDGFSCQGNRLAGPEVLDAAVTAFLATENQPLVERLLAALDAGERAGGDTKGHRSAAITVVGVEQYPLWDLRIDESDDPLDDLEELHRHVAAELHPQMAHLSRRGDWLAGFEELVTHTV